ncbi:MAG: hypothetical protein ACFFD4_14745 [Candidatus Odinarchaeota archaeon]
MMQINQTIDKFDWNKFNGTRVVVAAFGILCGLTGIIAGFFEIDQGNTATNGFIISTTGPDYNMANDFTYFAVTFIPNFLLTGIVAIIISSLVIIWSVRFIHRKHGATIFLVLSITQMLVGGGWVIDLAAITCILATRIGKPLDWWRSHLPVNFQHWLARLLPLSLLGYTIISFNMLVLSILGVNDEALINLIELLAAAMFVPLLLMVFGGLARDVQEQAPIIRKSVRS